jgi:hypothetical protein
MHSVESRCSGAAIQSAATSTRKEEDGIGLQLLKKGETNKKRKAESENRGVNPTTLSEKGSMTESHILDG